MLKSIPMMRTIQKTKRKMRKIKGSRKNYSNLRLKPKVKQAQDPKNKLQVNSPTNRLQNPNTKLNKRALQLRDLRAPKNLKRRNQLKRSLPPKLKSNNKNLNSLKQSLKRKMMNQSKNLLRLQNLLSMYL